MASCSRVDLLDLSFIQFAERTNKTDWVILNNMEDIEDFEDQIEDLQERIENAFADFDEANAVDKLNKVASIKKSIDSMADNTKYYKQAIQRLSMSNSGSEFMDKYRNYMKKIDEFKAILKKKKSQLKNEGGLDDNPEILEESVNLNDDIDKVRQIGINIQDKSKSKLEAIRARVAQTHQIADQNLEELERQKEQILRIQDSTQKLDSTMERTKKYLQYFGRSFWRDPVTLTMLFLILATIVGIIVVQSLDDKSKK